MNREVSLSRLIVEMIPACGATWGDLRRDIAGPSNEAIEFAIKGLIASGCVRRLCVADTGVFFLREHAPGADRDVPLGRPNLGKTESARHAREFRWAANPPKYKDGLRRCSRCAQYLDPANFWPCANGGQGLSSYCRPCQNESRKQRRAALKLAKAKNVS